MNWASKTVSLLGAFFLGLIPSLLHAEECVIEGVDLEVRKVFLSCHGVAVKAKLSEFSFEFQKALLNPATNLDDLIGVTVEVNRIRPIAELSLPCDAAERSRDFAYSSFGPAVTVMDDTFSAIEETVEARAASRFKHGRFGVPLRESMFTQVGFQIRGQDPKGQVVIFPGNRFLRPDGTTYIVPLNMGPLKPGDVPMSEKLK